MRVLRHPQLLLPRPAGRGESTPGRIWFSPPLFRPPVRGGGRDPRPHWKSTCVRSWDRRERSWPRPDTFSPRHPRGQHAGAKKSCRMGPGRPLGGNMRARLDSFVFENPVNFKWVLFRPCRAGRKSSNDAPPYIYIFIYLYIYIFIYLYI